MGNIDLAIVILGAGALFFILLGIVGLLLLHFGFFPGIGKFKE